MVPLKQERTVSHMEFKQVITSRCSVRAYQPQQIAPEQLQAVLEAAYNAPVGMREFDKLHLTVVQNPEIISRLVEIARGYAPEAIRAEFDPTHGAPTLIYVSESVAHSDLMTGCNTGCVMENMLLAAFDQGLGSLYMMGMVQMPAANPEPARLLGLPEGFRPVSAVALGYPVEEIAPRAVGERIATNFV